jgi:hypothetical protein
MEKVIVSSKDELREIITDRKINLSKIDVSNITDMSGLFEGIEYIN